MKSKTANWARSVKDRKSTIDFCTFVGGNLVTWRSKKQTVVAKSSAEAKYRAMSATTSELVWIKDLVEDLGLKIEEPIEMFCDNTSAMHIASNPVFHEKTKHIEVDCHYVRNKHLDKTISLVGVRSENQLADSLTKPPSIQQLSNFVDKLNLINLFKPNLRGSIEDNKLIEDVGH